MYKFPIPISQTEESVSIAMTSPLLTGREVVLVSYVQDNTKCIKNSVQQNAEFLNVNLLNSELNPICYLLALLGAHHFLHVSRIKVKLLTFRLLMSYIYGALILDVSRSHTTTLHSR